MTPPRPHHALLVTGIGTDVGKTVVSALLCRLWQADYYKPVQAGLPADLDTVTALSGLLGERLHPERHRLALAASPHTAARVEGLTLSVADIPLPDTGGRRLVVEGAGGLLVPLNDRGETIADLARHHDLPLIVVSRFYLGMINHTCLTLEVARARGLRVLGLVTTGDHAPAMLSAIAAAHPDVPHLLHVPMLESDPATGYPTATALEAFVAELAGHGPGGYPWPLDGPGEREQAPTDTAVWYPFDVYPDAPRPHIDRARGAWLYDAEGRPYLDAISSWWVNLHGHNPPRLVEALQGQAARLDQVIYAGLTHTPAEALARALVDSYPGLGPGARCFYSDDGSTAVEVALKLALHAQRAGGQPKRQGILFFEGAYHGDTFGAMSVGARGVFTRPYEAQFFAGAEAIPCPARPEGGLHGPITPAEQAALDHLDRILAERGDTLAALIVEPLLQGAAGMRMHGVAFLAGIVTRARWAGLLIIFDEVLTGFHRTGPRFAAGHLATDFPEDLPDLVCLSKALTGGLLPLGATLASSAIAGMLVDAPVEDRFLHGHSYTANPIACRVALESLRLLDEPYTLAALEAHTARLEVMAGRLQALPTLRHVRLLGQVLAFERSIPEAVGVTDLPAGPPQSSHEGYLAPARLPAYRYFLERGVILRPLGPVMYLLPPYTISDEDLRWLEGVIVEWATRGPEGLTGAA